MTQVNKDYVKMYLVPPEVLNKLRQDQKIENELDAEIQKILKLNNVNAMRKWLLYRQQLIRYMNKKRSPSVKVRDIDDAAAAMKEKPKQFDRAIQTTSSLLKTYKQTSDGAVQTDAPSTQVSPETIYESSVTTPLKSEAATTTTTTNTTNGLTQEELDEIAQLTSPTNRKNEPYDFNKILEPIVVDDSDEELELKDLRRQEEAKKKAKAKKVLAFETANIPKPPKQPNVSASRVAKETRLKRAKTKRTDTTDAETDDAAAAAEAADEQKSPKKKQKTTRTLRRTRSSSIVQRGTGSGGLLKWIILR